MKTNDLEIAIDRAQWLVRRLTEARTLRWHGMNDKAEREEKLARLSLEDVADLIGFEIVAKEVA